MKTDLLRELKSCVAAFEAIDKATPWRETESAWWLAWSECARNAREAIKNATYDTDRLLAAARRVLSANQESQPREYHEAMSELGKIVDSPLDTQPVSDQARGQMELNETLLAALRELVRDMEENTTVGNECGEHTELVFATRSRVVCHTRTFENAKAAIQAASPRE